MCLSKYLMYCIVFLRRALLAQHESRRVEIMANFGSVQTSLTMGRKAMQRIQHYELRLKKEKMYGWVSTVQLIVLCISILYS